MISNKWAKSLLELDNKKSLSKVKNIKTKVKSQLSNPQTPRRSKVLEGSLKSRLSRSRSSLTRAWVLDLRREVALSVSMMRPA